MKGGRTEIAVAVGGVKEMQWTNQDGQQSRNDLPRQAEMTAACRDLEDAVCVG